MRKILSALILCFVFLSPTKTIGSAVTHPRDAEETHRKGVTSISWVITDAEPPSTPTQTQPGIKVHYSDETLSILELPPLEELPKPRTAGTEAAPRLAVHTRDPSISGADTKVDLSALLREPPKPLLPSKMHFSPSAVEGTNFTDFKGEGENPIKQKRKTGGAFKADESSDSDAAHPKKKQRATKRTKPLTTKWRWRDCQAYDMFCLSCCVKAGCCNWKKVARHIADPKLPLCTSKEGKCWSSTSQCLYSSCSASWQIACSPFTCMSKECPCCFGPCSKGKPICDKWEKCATKRKGLFWDCITFWSCCLVCAFFDDCKG